MRRPALFVALLIALALPATALALHAATGDGTLVVKDASGPAKTPVVALTITGAVIGHVAGGRGHIVIDPGPSNDHVPEVTGYDSRRDSPTSDTAQIWYGTDFKFRAVGGHWTILIYGSNVDVVAIGKGSVTLTGLADNPLSDGKYSVNGDPVFHSLPAVSTTKSIGTSD
jgi:hypothetical protein